MSITKTQLGEERLLVHTESGRLMRARLYREISLGCKGYRLILKGDASSSWERHNLEAQTDDNARAEANKLIKSFGLKLAKSA